MTTRAKITKLQKEISAANKAYVDAFLQWQGTKHDASGTSECAANSRAAVPGLRRSAWTMWERLVTVSSSATPAERAIFAWAIRHDAYAPGQMTE